MSRLPSDVAKMALDAASQWASGINARQRRLAPWDEMTYFDTPAESTITLGVTNPTQICAGNPQRVGLIIGCPQHADPVTVSTNPNAAFGTGIVLNDSSLPWVITQRDLGPLCQVAWFALGTPGQFITVIEIVLHQWPTVGQ